MFHVYSETHHSNHWFIGGSAFGIPFAKRTSIDSSGNMPRIASHKPMTTWWFQHIYKILVKLDHVRIMSPSREVNIQNPWDHHPDDHVVHPENASSTCTCHFNPPADFLAAAWRSLQSENILELTIKQTYHTWNKIWPNKNNNQLNLTSLEKWTTLSKKKLMYNVHTIYICMFSISNFEVMSPDFPTKIG